MRLTGTEFEIETGRRLRKGERYRVSAINDWDSSVIERQYWPTLRSAAVCRADWEKSGIRAVIEIVTD